MKESEKPCAGAYRFGYQGSEKDDEITGVTGSHYTTHYRGLDTRIGRWLSVDPKTRLTPWESPYLSMGANPIWHNDPLGDYWKRKKDKKRANRMNKVADKKINNYQNQIKDLDPKKDAKQIENLNAQISDLQNVKSELQTMEDNKDIAFSFKFHLNFKGNGATDGYTDKNGVKTVDMYFTHRGSLFHEAKHGFQHSIGELSFKRDKEGFDPSYTVSDEVGAKRREYSISSDRYKRKTFLNQEGYLEITNERWIKAYNRYKNKYSISVKEYDYLLKQYSNGKK